MHWLLFDHPVRRDVTAHLWPGLSKFGTVNRCQTLGYSDKCRQQPGNNHCTGYRIVADRLAYKYATRLAEAIKSLFVIMASHKLW